MKFKRGYYEDMLYMDHHVSQKHPHMSIEDRAAQFSPFAALNGHEEAIEETARLTEGFIELSEDEKALLDAKMNSLIERLSTHPVLTVVYFKPDLLKEGGSYVTVTGRLHKVKRLERYIEIEGGEIIRLDDIYRIYEEE